MMNSIPISRSRAREAEAAATHVSGAFVRHLSDGGVELVAPAGEFGSLTPESRALFAQFDERFAGVPVLKKLVEREPTAGAKPRRKTPTPPKSVVSHKILHKRK